MVESENFEFLREKHPVLADLGGFAEKYVWTDPMASLGKQRLLAEHLVKIIYKLNGFHFNPYDKFIDLLSHDEFKQSTPPVILEKLGAVRKYGNRGIHGAAEGIAPVTANWLLHETHDLAKWFFIRFSNGSMKEISGFRDVPRPASTENPDVEKNRLQKMLEKKEEKMARLLQKLEQVRSAVAPLAKSEREKQSFLAHSQQCADSLGFNETETRKHIINRMLLESGWNIDFEGKDTEAVRQEMELDNQPTQTGKGYADYVLFDDNGLPLAVIEAKKTAGDASQGKTQARLYADALESQYKQRPIIFYTNGFEIWMWDDAKGEVPRKIYGFYSKDSLRYCIQKTRERRKLADLGPKTEIIDRMYQMEAITRVTEKFETLRRRKALIVLATGTGKTRVAIALCEMLFRARWAQRVLFLCDRRELRKQARDVFAEFMPHEPRVYVSRRTRGDLNRRIYLSTYPGMMESYANFDTGFFDLIIADESHRSIYNKYRELFLYFDALQVGLTATPVNLISRNTYEIFECEDQDPTSYFSYEEAVAHRPPYLVPYRVIKHTTKFLSDGVKYSEMTPEQRKQLEEQLENAAEDVEYAPNQVDSAIYNEDTEAKVLRLFMDKGLRNADGSTIGKTIVFARNHNHAIYLRDLFYKLFPQYGAEFCEVIDNKEPRRDALIDSFKTEPKLMVAISVDMLDTGIDVPEVVNLVFHKPVKSYVKFRQMIGRGTRLCPNLFGTGRHKEEFYIFDHWGNFDSFGEEPDERETSVSKGIFQQIFESRVELAKTALETQNAEAFDRALLLIEKDILALPKQSVFIKEKRREVEGVKNPERVRRFDAQIHRLLIHEIAPLMQWRKPQAKDAAYKFDLYMTRASVARLTGSSDYDDLSAVVIEWVSRLPINLTQVRDKLIAIQHCKSKAFWMEATVQSLEQMREEFRGIMHLATVILEPAKPLKINVTDKEGAVVFGGVSEPKSDSTGDPMRAYRHRVESVLKEIVGQSPALQKIRAGQPVSEEDISRLTQQVALRDPHLDLEMLLESCNADKLEEALLQIVGLSSEAVNSRLTAFAQLYPELTANQLRFLDMMKSFISKHGTLRIEQLYYPPFASMGTLDELFPEAQRNDLFAIVREMNQI